MEWPHYLTIFNTVAEWNGWGANEKAQQLKMSLRGPALQVTEAEEGPQSPEIISQLVEEDKYDHQQQQDHHYQGVVGLQKENDYSSTREY